MDSPGLPKWVPKPVTRILTKRVTYEARGDSQGKIQSDSKVMQSQSKEWLYVSGAGRCKKDCPLGTAEETYFSQYLDFYILGSKTVKTN